MDDFLSARDAGARAASPATGVGGSGGAILEHSLQGALSDIAFNERLIRELLLKQAYLCGYVDTLRGASPATPASHSLPAVVDALLSASYVDGKPLISKKQHWFYLYRIMEEQGIVTKMARFVEMLPADRIPQALMPTRDSIQKLSNIFGNTATRYPQWRNVAQIDIDRGRSIAEIALRYLGNG